MTRTQESLLKWIDWSWRAPRRAAKRERRGQLNLTLAWGRPSHTRCPGIGPPPTRPPPSNFFGEGAPHARVSRDALPVITPGLMYRNSSLFQVSASLRWAGGLPPSLGDVSLPSSKLTLARPARRAGGSCTGATASDGDRSPGAIHTQERGKGGATAASFNLAASGVSRRGGTRNADFLFLVSRPHTGRRK